MKAVQTRNGAYIPDREWCPAHRSNSCCGAYRRFTREGLVQHIKGEISLGHYLVNEGTCRLFAFDIDLTQVGDLQLDAESEPMEVRPREIWAAPIGFAVEKELLTIALRCTAESLAQVAHSQLGIDVAVSCSGSKGLHVYCWTGEIDAVDARALATSILTELGFVPAKGNNFFKRPNSNILDVEIYPKQDEIKADGFGNLMRLPLGRNLKGGASFFVDLNTPWNTLTAEDPALVLAQGSLR